MSFRIKADFDQFNLPPAVVRYAKRGKLIESQTQGDVTNQFRSGLGTAVKISTRHEKIPVSRGINGGKKTKTRLKKFESGSSRKL